MQEIVLKIRLPQDVSQEDAKLVAVLSQIGIMSAINQTFEGREMYQSPFEKSVVGSQTCYITNCELLTT